MAEVKFSRLAEADLRSILGELRSAAGPNTAALYALSFRDAVNRLTLFPGSGHPRRKMGRNIRIVVVSPYLIFYEGQQRSKIVQVLRVLHGRRRITKAMVAAGRRS